MPRFSYQILDANGQRLSGLLDGSGVTEVAAELRSSGARILAIHPANATASKTRESTSERLRPVRSEAICQVFSHLAMMLRSGIALSQALHLIVPEVENRRLRRALTQVLEGVETGHTLSSQLSGYPHLFSPVVIGIMAGAEESGEMADGLERIAAHLTFWGSLRRKLLQSLAYPTIIIVVAIAVTVLLVTVFIPKVEAYLQSNQRNLPALTQWVFDFSGFVQSSWPWLLGMALLALVALAAAWTRPRFRLFAERGLLRLPILGEAWRAAMLARVSGLLTVLLQSGTPLLRAIEVSENALKASPVFAATFARSRDRVLRGESLRASLHQSELPASALGVIAAGEESGNLVRAFRQLETYYAERLSNRVSTVASLLEPALILFVGGIVAVVYLALFSSVVSVVR
jgi:type II secretory pathway component PulF